MFVGVDWGTTNCRAYLFDNDTIVDQREGNHGILHVANFRQSIDDFLQNWPVVPVIFSGMIGSSKGWIEVPYQRVPLDLSDILSSLHDISSHWNREAYILGGLDFASTNQDYDVMRGEELQILGLQKEVQEQSIAVLLGTHSKHVLLNSQKILSFQTFLTGELFSVLQKHSIFAGSIENNDADFLMGVQKSADKTLLANLFLTRSLSLSQQISYPRSFLSGLLIGTELRCLPPIKHILVGSSALLPWYQKAYQSIFGIHPHSISSDRCNQSGYQQLAAHMKWISKKK